MRRVATLMIALILSLGLMTGPAFAFHCYVENKPNGAGARTLDDIKPAGKSGKLVLPGAFVNLSGFDEALPDQDVFRRGQPVDDDDGIVGLGTLPEPPHDRGGSNGVQALPFEPPPPPE